MSETWAEPLGSSHSRWIKCRFLHISVMRYLQSTVEDEFFRGSCKERLPEELAFEGWAGTVKLVKAQENNSRRRERQEQGDGGRARDSSRESPYHINHGIDVEYLSSD